MTRRAADLPMLGMDPSEPKKAEADGSMFFGRAGLALCHQGALLSIACCTFLVIRVGLVTACTSSFDAGIRPGEKCFGFLDVFGRKIRCSIFWCSRLFAEEP